MRHERCVSISRCRAGLAALTRGSNLTATGVEVLPDDSSASTITPLAPRCSSRMVRSPAASWNQYYTFRGQSRAQGVVHDCHGTMA